MLYVEIFLAFPQALQHQIHELIHLISVLNRNFQYDLFPLLNIQYAECFHYHRTIAMLFLYLYHVMKIVIALNFSA